MKKSVSRQENQLPKYAALHENFKVVWQTGPRSKICWSFLYRHINKYNLYIVLLSTSSSISAKTEFYTLYFVSITQWITS